MYSRVYFSLSSFGDFREVANSAKIKPSRKIPYIQHHHETSHRLPMSWGCALMIGVKSPKVKVSVHWFLKYVLAHSLLLYLYTYSNETYHTDPSLSPGYVLLILGSKCQRAWSKCSDNRKGFLLHNCSIFTPIIMKPHMKTPHELKMCPIDVMFKRSKAKVIMQGLRLTSLT